MNEEMNAAGLLRAAARLVRKANEKLDRGGTPCGECGAWHFNNKEEKRISEQIDAVPDKLARAAAILEKRPDAVAGRAQRREIDTMLKKS